jgi:hypothetical protein
MNDGGHKRREERIKSVSMQSEEEMGDEERRVSVHVLFVC